MRDTVHGGHSLERNAATPPTTTMGRVVRGLMKLLRVAINQEVIARHQHFALGFAINLTPYLSNVAPNSVSICQMLMSGEQYRRDVIVIANAEVNFK